MSGKEKEGTNQARRALARDSREAGLSPSEAGVTLGASKQHEYVTRGRREGPPAAGARKPVPGTARPPTKGEPERPWPMPEPDGPGAQPGAWPVVRYRDLVTEVGRRTGLDFDQARRAAEATVMALARALDDMERERFLDGVPRELHNDHGVTVIGRPQDLPAFIREVGRIAHRPPEQARYNCQAVLSVLMEQDPTVIEGLHLPDGVAELTAPPNAGGGLVGPGGHSAPLTGEELRDALVGLPYWTPTDHGLAREINLPRGNLDRVLRRLEALRGELGRAPHIGRPNPETARLVVRTGRAAGAVTALDVDLAHRVDAAIEEAGAGMASG